MPNIVYQIIEAAHKRIEQGWTQGRLARNNTGINVSIDSPYAKCWCLAGAMQRGTVDVCKMSRDSWNNEYSNAYILATTVVRKILPEGIIAWNDENRRTREEVLAVLDLALENAKTLEGVPA